MLSPKYLLVERDHMTRGVFVERRCWIRWLAALKARRLTARYAAEHAQQARSFIDARTPRFTWEVQARCN